MYIFFAVLITIACVLLIGAVLIQKSKGAGLASGYSQGNQFMGYRKTTDFIEKATWSLAIAICLLSIFSAYTVKGPVQTSGIKNAPVQTAAPAPAAPTQAPAPAPAPAAPAN